MSRAEQIESLFHQARLLPSGADRAAWIEAQCTGDQDLQREVLSLLKAHAEMARAQPASAAPRPGIPAAHFGAYHSTPIGGEARAMAIPLNLYMTLAREGKIAEAERGLAELKPNLDRIAPGPVYVQGYFALVSGVCALKRGNATTAEREIREALGVYEHAVQPGHVYFVEAQRWLASALEAQKRIPEARAAANEAVRIWSQTTKPETRCWKKLGIISTS